MKQLKFFVIVLILIISKSANAQSVADVFNSKTLTWYGLDFSHARFVGDFGPTVGKNGNVLRDGFFSQWNNTIIREVKKYDFAKYYDKDSFDTNITDVESINSKIDAANVIVSAPPTPLTESILQNEVNKYAKGKSGIGLVYFVEVFNKTAVNGIINIVFFERSSGKILLTKRIQSKPGGFGVKNYWLKSVLETMETSKEEWKKWKKESGVKK